jgi:cell division protein FtsZ
MAKTIRIIGFGGAGCNVASYLHTHTETNAEYLLCDTDKQMLKAYNEEQSYYLNKVFTTQDDVCITSFVQDAKQIILIAGLGGDAGTSAILHFANILNARKTQCLCILLYPFPFEGSKKKLQANDTIKLLQKQRHIEVSVFYNEQLLKASRTTPMSEAFLRQNAEIAEFLNKKLNHISSLWERIKNMFHRL